MFRASASHLQEDTVVHMQHMVLPLYMRVLGGLSVHSLSENSRREWQYHICTCTTVSSWRWALEARNM